MQKWRVEKLISSIQKERNASIGVIPTHTHVLKPSDDTVHYMMLVFVSLLLCIGAFVNGDNVTLGIKKDGSVMNTRSCIDKERQALLRFKANLVDIFNSLVDWNTEGEKWDFCKWQGVLCDKLTGLCHRN